MNLFLSLIIASTLLTDFSYEVPFEKGDTQKIYYDETYDKRLTDNSINIIPLLGLRFYQIFISPAQGEVCNFTPSCSNYMFQSLRKYGLFLGFLKGVDRLQRCNFSVREYVNLFYDSIVLIQSRGYKIIDKP
ncbi:MAG: membrane protein insertion efficiency factor YidD [candidate division WOR-3 bacterium]